MDNLFSGHNQKIYNVSELSSSLKGVIESNFSHIRVSGEISGLKKAASGHIYFNLKDDNNLIKGICWAGVAKTLPLALADGLEIVATGKITTYAGRSEYQIVISSAELAGQGALLALLEKRKKQFEAEGLFSSEHKKKLPFLPSKIGVVTSPTGAVIRDILHRISERFPVHVQVWSVLVQGEGAKEQVANAINGFNAMQSPPDLLIIARGGGSIEDLWAFNEEIVVRAAFASKIPLISAIGHETDNSLLDLVADYRAPTPTAAAEKAVPERVLLMSQIKDYSHRLPNSLLRITQRNAEKIEALARLLPKAEDMLGSRLQMLDDRGERLNNSLPKLLAMQQMKLEKMRVSLRHPKDIINLAEHKLQAMTARLQLRSGELLDKPQRNLENLSRLLQNVGHKQILQRGYAIVRGDNGAVINSVHKAEEKMQIIFHDGEISVHKK